MTELAGQPATPAADPPPQPAPTQPSTPLGMGQRVTAGVVAIIAAGAGGVSVFVQGSSGAPATALIALGAFFGYVGLSGQRILSAKVGDNEVKLSNVVTATLADPAVPIKVKGEIAERVVKSGAELHPGASSSVLGMVTDRLRDMGLLSPMHNDDNATVRRVVGLLPHLRTFRLSFSQDSPTATIGLRNGLVVDILAFRSTQGPSTPVTYYSLNRRRASENVTIGLPGASIPLHLAWKSDADDAHLALLLNRWIEEAVALGMGIDQPQDEPSPPQATS